MSCQPPEAGRPARRYNDAPLNVLRPRPTPRDDLQHLPARILLNRIPTPVLALGFDGEVIYANPAFTMMLGYPGLDDLTKLPLSNLMAGRADTPARDCVAALRSGAGTVTDWCHADGYILHAMVSKPLLTRATDSVLLIMLIDVTDVLWG